MNAKSTAEDKERWSKVRCWNCGKLGHTVRLCPEDDDPEAQAGSKQAHTKRKEKWAQKNDSRSAVSTISTVSVKSSASAAATQAPPPSAAFTYETTEKPRPVGPHANITGQKPNETTINANEERVLFCFWRWSDSSSEEQTTAPPPPPQPHR